MDDISNTEFDAAAWAEATSGEVPAQVIEDEAQNSSAADAADVTEGAEETGAAAETQQDEAASEPLKTDPETIPSDDAIWADAPEHLKTAFEAVRSERDRLQHQRKSDAGRVAVSQRTAHELQRKIGAVNLAAKQEDLKSYLDSDEYKKAKGEYGSDLGPVFTLLERVATETEATQQVQSRFLDTQAIGVAQEVENWLDSEAPDRAELFGHADFKPWLDAQPKWLRDLAQRNWNGVVDPAEVVEVCDKWRAHLGLDRPAPATETPAIRESQNTEIDRKRQLQLQGSKSVTSRAPMPIGVDENDENAAWNEAVAAKEKRASARR